MGLTMKKLKPRKTAEYRKIRMSYVKQIMDLVRDKIKPGKYMEHGPIIALVMFDIEGRIDVAIYRDSKAGPLAKSFSGTTKELWSQRKLWAAPYLNKNGKWRLKHVYVTGKGLTYNEDNYLGGTHIDTSAVPSMSRLKHYFN